MDGETETFGAGLRFWRERRELSQRRLAAMAYCGKTHISELERGLCRARPELAAQLDRLLEADGALLGLATVSRDIPTVGAEPSPLDPRSYTELAVNLLAAGGDTDMLDRRTFVLGLGSATSLGAIAPGLALEATRHGLALSLAEQRATAAVDEWHEIVWEYGFSYLSVPPRELLDSLVIDMLGLQVALDRAATERRSGTRSAAVSELRQVGATLAALMAMTIANIGDVRHARRWWRTANDLAEQSSHTPTILWVRGREVIRALYESRPAPVILQMIEKARPYTVDADPAHCAELTSAKAQASALAGRRADAEAALDEVRVIYDNLPSDVFENRDSIYGWPENRLRFTESYVYSYLGDTTKAAGAQDRAVAVYPSSYRRGPAQIELQRALCMVSAGDVTTGVQHATSALEALPARDLIRPIVSLAHSVSNAVPGFDQTRPAVREFHERLSLTTG